MNRWAIVPVKSLQKTKSRLASVLSPAERSALIQHLLRRTLTILQESGWFTQILVVTRDPVAQQIAQTAGASAFMESEGHTLNGALTEATQYATSAGAEQLLILPTDLPLFTAADLEPLFNHPSSAVVICSDILQTGTNALVRPIDVPFTYHFGPNSFALHTAEAERHQITMISVHVPGLQFDLDTPHDWAILSQLDTQPHMHRG